MIEITGWSALLSGGEEEGEVGLWKREVPKVAWCLLLLGWLVFNNLGRILKVFFIVFRVCICGVYGNVYGERVFRSFLLPTVGSSVKLLLAAETSCGS